MKKKALALNAHNLLNAPPAEQEALMMMFCKQWLRKMAMENGGKLTLEMFGSEPLPEVCVTGIQRLNEEYARERN